MRPRDRIQPSFLVFVASLTLLATPLAARAACPDNACVARITTGIWTGQPSCGDPQDITVKVVVAVACPGCSYTATFYKCGQATDSYQFSACGKTHTVSLSSGTWGDAVGAGCSSVVWTYQ